MGSFFRITVFLFIFLLLSCNLAEIAITQLSTYSSDFLFSENEKEDLRQLFVSLNSSKTCDEVYKSLDNNRTLYDIEKKYNLGEFFIYKELSEINPSTLFQIQNSSPGKSATVSVIAVWRNYYSTDEVFAVLKNIKNCVEYRKESLQRS